MRSRIRSLATAVLALAVSAAPAAGQASTRIVSNACAGVPHCVEVTPFVATVTDFRESAASYYRLLTVTVRFQNKTDRPLVLGYVNGSGVGTDDRGNRYEAQNGSLRGLGIIQGRTFDGRFTLGPGESSDARLELSFRPGNAVLGTRYVLELAVREIEPLERNQWQLGREHALQYSGLGEVVAQAAPAAAPAGTAAPTPTPAPGPVSPPAPKAPPVDPCAEKARCYAAGPFTAQVTRVAESKVTYYHVLTVTVKFTNLTSERLLLAYQAGSAIAVDDQGNRLPGSRSANQVRGMGIAQGTRVDPSFALNPGQSRDATFEMNFRPGRAVIGTSYAFDLAVVQLEALPRNQLRTVREFAVGFTDLTPGGGNAVEGLLNKIRKP